MTVVQPMERGHRTQIRQRLLIAVSRYRDRLQHAVLVDLDASGTAGQLVERGFTGLDPAQRAHPVGNRTLLHHREIRGQRGDDPLCLRVIGERSPRGVERVVQLFVVGGGRHQELGLAGGREQRVDGLGGQVGGRTQGLGEQPTGHRPHAGQPDQQPQLIGQHHLQRASAPVGPMVKGGPLAVHTAAKGSGAATRASPCRSNPR